MHIVKPLNNAVLTRTFQYQKRHFMAVSALWAFRLSDGANIPEIPMWKLVLEQLGKNALLDEAINKSRAEFLVYGQAFAPNGIPVERLEVDVQLGDVHKRLNVVGDRHWNGFGPTAFISKPKPFTAMPLDTDHAFGGNNHPFNLTGKGMPPADPKAEPLHWLPNIEHPSDPITSPNSRPFPAGFAALDLTWPIRHQRAGTYDELYLREHMPGLAPDIDWTFFNMAPEDQWFEGFLRGDESYQLTNLHPDKPLLAGQLPNVVARVILEQQTTQEPSLQELTMALDTVHFFPNVDLGILVHRGSLEIHDPLGQDITKLLIAHQGLQDTAQPTHYYVDQLRLRTDPEQGFKYMLSSAALLPVGVRCALATMADDLLADKQRFMSDNLQTYAEQMETRSQSQLQEQQAQLCAELEANGLHEEAQRLRDMKPTQEPEPDTTQAEYQALVDAILPDAANANQKLDLTTFNPDAMPALFEHMEQQANTQVDQAVAELEAQLAEARQQIWVPGMAELVRKLEEMLAALKEPPVLPRPSKLSLEATRQSMTDALKELDGLPDQPLLSDDVKRQQEELNRMLAELNKPEMGNDMESANAFVTDGYRFGAHFLPLARSPHPGEEALHLAQMLANHQQQITCQHSDLAYTELQDTSLAGICLTDSYAEYAQWQNICLDNADLSGAIFAHTKLKHISFRQSDLRGINLGAAALQDCVFEDIDFADATFAKSTLLGCRFVNCQFGERMDAFLETRFQQCVFERCDLREKMFIKLAMPGTLFIDCQLANATFLETYVKDGAFQGCDLTATNFISAQLQHGNFSRAQMINTRFIERCNLTAACFDHAVMHQANLRGCLLEGATFDHADISESDFSQATLDKTKGFATTAVKTQFMETTFNHSQWQKAQLMEANFMQADLRGADFQGSNLYGAAFLKATLGDTRFAGAQLDKTILSEWRPGIA